MTEKVRWYFKTDHITGSSEWQKYRDIENDIIEEAFQKQESNVLLDRYRINFKQSVQIDCDNEMKQRCVRREIVSDRQTSLREYRFGSIPSTTTSSSYGSHDSWCPFLQAWFRTLSGKRAFIDHQRCLEACAQGIIKEGELHDDHSKLEAAYMAKKLLECIGKPRIEATKLCINFYTKDTFLYFTLNKALREEDHSKLETLGPYCFLLRNYSRFSENHIGTVYRGAMLNSSDIDAYREAIGEWKTWPAFTSTSKDRHMAEAFGNTLLIIEITPSLTNLPRSYDIAHMSDYPSEKEILIPAGTLFQTMSVEKISSEESIITVKL